MEYHLAHVALDTHSLQLLEMYTQNKTSQYYTMAALLQKQMEENMQKIMTFQSKADGLFSDNYRVKRGQTALTATVIQVFQKASNVLFSVTKTSTLTLDHRICQFVKHLLTRQSQTDGCFSEPGRDRTDTTQLTADVILTLQSKLHFPCGPKELSNEIDAARKCLLSRLPSMLARSDLHTLTAAKALRALNVVSNASENETLKDNIAAFLRKRVKGMQSQSGFCMW